MLLREGKGQPKSSWEDSAGRGLHRASERTAAVVGAQFRARLLGDGAVQAAGRIDDKVLNVRPDPVDFRDAVYQASLIELKTRMIPQPLDRLGLAVRDQGTEGSCTGQALAAVIDLQNIVRLRDGADVPDRVSPRMLYEVAKTFDEHADDGLPGSSIRGAIKGFFHRGVCGSDLAPYFPGDIDWRLDVETARAARKVTLGAYFRLRHLLNDYHAALCEVRALLCSAMVHDGWSEAAVRANGNFIRSPGGDPKKVKLTGAHAFALVGYEPEGFIVLNSYGERWGGYTPAAEGGGRGDPLPGMALWPYDEWCEHILDAWALRLQAPAKLPSGFTGGYHLVRRPTQNQDDPHRAAGIPASVPAMDIAGHFVNVADGKFVTAPPYDNERHTFEETRRFLIGNEADERPHRRYKHLLLFADGGAGSTEVAAARAAAMTPVFKQNGVYPVFFLWHTGLGALATDVLHRLFASAADRAGGFSAYSDGLLETAVRPIARPVWRSLKEEARRCFAKPNRAGGGDAWTAARLLMEAAVDRRRHPLRVHMVGHGAGSIFLGEMFARAAEDGFPMREVLGTVSLLAPACTTEFFDRTLAPVADGMSGGRKDAFSVYHLLETDERADNVAGVYRKSFLYLISNAFEEVPQTPLAGMEVHRRPWPGVTYVSPSSARARSVAARCQAKTHMGFDNDPVTMNHLLARVLGRARMRIEQEGFSEADLTGRGF